MHWQRIESHMSSCRLGPDPGSSYHAITGRVEQRWQRRPPCLGTEPPSPSCRSALEAARSQQPIEEIERSLADCVVNASISNDLVSVEHLGPLLPAWNALLRSRRAVRVPVFQRWHVETQEQLFGHLRRVWSDDVPRVMIDAGCHAGHGRFFNLSDALLWLHHFSHDGGLVVGVDAFEDFALDHQHRLEDVEPYRSMRGIKKLTLTRAVHTIDGQSLDLFKLAQQQYECCGWRMCHIGLDAVDHAGHDHMCRIPRQRLRNNRQRRTGGSALPLPASSFPQALMAAVKGRAPPMPYPIATARLDTIWREAAAGRHIDFLKIDVDMPWHQMGLEGLLSARAFSVMLIEVDGYWGGVKQDFGVTAVDELLWLADRSDYEPYIKVPCVAKAHVVSPAWETLSRGVAVRYKRMLRRHRRRPGFVPTLYSAEGRGAKVNIQDLVLVDRRRPELKQLEALGDADCEESLIERTTVPSWLPPWRGDDDSAPPAWVTSWVGSASPGYCQKTVKPGNCGTSSKGMFPLLPDEAMSWADAVHACMRRCLACQRCKYISVSMQWQDCSWFAHCEKTRLHTDVPAFLTGPRVQQGSVLA